MLLNVVQQHFKHSDNYEQTCGMAGRKVENEKIRKTIKSKLGYSKSCNRLEWKSKVT